MLTIDHIKDLSYDVQEVRPRIYLVSNFATPDEIAALHEEVESAAEEEWSYSYLAETKKHSLAKFGRDDLENLIAEGLLEVTDHFADKTLRIKDENLRFTLQHRATEIFNKAGDLEFTGFINHQRLYPGSYLTAHFDQYSDKLVQYAAVLYINNDYVDGEVFFPDHNLQLRPAPGDLLIFPGTKEYVHGVHPVGEGPVRYILPAFIKTRHPDGAMAGWGDFG
jgi:hypothetical protein